MTKSQHVHVQRQSTLEREEMQEKSARDYADEALCNH